MAFAQTSDLLKRYDWRLIADLSTDEGVSQTEAETLANANVSEALEDASGEIVVALQSGRRYTEADLTGLSGYSQQHLKRVCCDIAMYLLIKRRPIVDEDQTAAIAKQAREHLRKLGDGENVFGIQENIDAGSLSLATPSTIEVEQLNLVTERMSRFFPRTDTRMPRGR